LTDAFDQQVRQLYTSEEAQEGCVRAVDKRGVEGKYPLMSLSIGVANNQFRDFKSAKKMFEVLAQLRQMARSSDGKSTIFIDRRRTDR
jgi:hypothetical protein